MRFYGFTAANQIRTANASGEDASFNPEKTPRTSQMGAPRAIDCYKGLGLIRKTYKVFNQGLTFR